MRRSLAKFSESEVSNHTPSWADFITATPAFKFPVHTVRALLSTAMAKPFPCPPRMLSSELGLFEIHAGFGDDRPKDCQFALQARREFARCGRNDLHASRSKVFLHVG